MISGEPLFNGDFEAWKYGPVLIEIRNEYMTGNMFSGNYSLNEDEKKLVESVFKRYDLYDAWELSTLSHAEGS